jgi:hypothetical protein
MTVQQGNPRRILPFEASALLLSTCCNEVLTSGFLRLDLCAISSISKEAYSVVCDTYSLAGLEISKIL